MLVGFICALVLAGTLLVLRGRVGPNVPVWVGRATRAEKIVAALVLVVGAVPLLRVFPGAHGAPATFFGDSLSHVHVARDVLRHGLPHGWLDTYLAGFPFGHHYPPLGTLVLAATVWTGLSSAAAAHFWGFAGTLAAPLALHVGAVRAGARPPFAAVGAVCFAWTSPYNPFVGGYEAFFQLGLLSQVLALPMCIAFAALVARRNRVWSAPVAALAMASHPQLTVATLVVVGLAAAASASRGVLESFARGALGALLFGLALYGQGIATLGIPFGWPPDFGWRHLGFGAARLDWWFLDGDLLDRGRDVAALTALATAAVLVLLLRAVRPVARAGLVALLFAVGLAISGPTLSRVEPIGPALLSVLQPLRALALVPPIAGALVVVALEETAPLVRQALANLGRVRSSRFVVWVELCLVVLVLATALPQRLFYVENLGSELERRAGGHCDGGPPGYRRAEITAWVRRLRGGRLWFEDREDDALERCLVLDGVPLESSVPIGITGGVGAHVGMHWLAYHRLEPAREGSARRAEALGVRHLLAVGEPAAGFIEQRRSGDIGLFSHAGPTELVGAGCIVERWRGSDPALRNRLVGELKTSAGADRLLDPRRFVALEPSRGELLARAHEDATCDATDVRVTESPREPGALEALIETRAPVDVVFRVAAFPTWKVFIDGARAEPIRMVAPGFVTARVGPGRHRVLALVTPMPGYAWLVALGALGVGALAVVRSHHMTRAFERARRRLTGTSP